MPAHESSRGIPVEAMDTLTLSVAKRKHFSCATRRFCAQDFVSKLIDLPESARAALAEMTPATYIGSAAEQVPRLQHCVSYFEHRDIICAASSVSHTSRF